MMVACLTGDEVSRTEVEFGRNQIIVTLIRPSLPANLWYVELNFRWLRCTKNKRFCRNEGEAREVYDSYVKALKEIESLSTTAQEILIQGIGNV